MYGSSCESEEKERKGDNDSDGSEKDEDESEDGSAAASDAYQETCVRSYRNCRQNGCSKTYKMDV